MNTIKKNKSSFHREVIGLVPAAGRATRIAPLPCSKELLPVCFESSEKNGSARPRVISQYLLEAMERADIKKAYIIVREGKWDIPAYFGDGKGLDMHLAYLLMDLPYGVPYTLDQAFPFVNEAVVALGFPDMIIQPDDAFVTLLSRQQQSNADIVLGLFPASRPEKTDMVEVDDNGKVTSIYIKPDHTDLIYAWEIAVWTPVFTRFMHTQLMSREERRKDKGEYGDEKELHISHIVQAAIEENFYVDTLIFNDGNCLDIGTPGDLLRAVRSENQCTKM